MNFKIETAVMQRVIKLLGTVAKIGASDFSGRILIEAKENGEVSWFVNNNSTAIQIKSDNVEVVDPGTTSVTYGEVKSFIMSFVPFKDNSGVKEFSFTDKKSGFFIYVKNIHNNGGISNGKIKLTQYDTFGIALPSPFGKATFIINSEIFKEATNKVLYAIDPNMANQGLCGMSLRFDDSHICFAGTNGRTLSEYKTTNISDLKDKAFILKYDFITGVRRIIQNDTQIFFEINEGKAAVKMDDVCLWGRVLLQDYPMYEDYLNDFKDVVVIDKDMFMSDLLPLSEVLDIDDNKRLTLSISEGKLQLKTDSALFEYGNKIDWDGVFDVDINGNYLLSTLDVIKDDDILFKFGGAGGNVILDSKKNENQRSLITSIRKRG